MGQGLRDVVGAFGSEPDPKMCYLDPARRQAALRILSGIEKDESFFVLTGQEGIGKTTLLSHLALRLHERDGVLPLCPRGLTAGRFAEASEPELHLGALGAAPLKAAQRLQELTEGGQSPVLLVDDGDLLGDDVLEAIIILTRLRAADRRLLSVCMAARPSILDRIASITGGGEKARQFEPLSSCRWSSRRLAGSFVIDSASPGIPVTRSGRMRSPPSQGRARVFQAPSCASAAGQSRWRKAAHSQR